MNFISVMTESIFNLSSGFCFIILATKLSRSAYKGWLSAISLKSEPEGFCLVKHSFIIKPKAKISAASVILSALFFSFCSGAA
ncbi:hypothetical protein D3C85_1509340 [compost metagenome]